MELSLSSCHLRGSILFEFRLPVIGIYFEVSKCLDKAMFTACECLRSRKSNQVSSGFKFVPFVCKRKMFQQVASSFFEAVENCGLCSKTSAGPYLPISSRLEEIIYKIIALTSL